MFKKGFVVLLAVSAALAAVIRPTLPDLSPPSDPHQTDSSRVKRQVLNPWDQGGKTKPFDWTRASTMNFYTNEQRQQFRRHQLGPVRDPIPPRVKRQALNPWGLGVKTKPFDWTRASTMNFYTDEQQQQFRRYQLGPVRDPIPPSDRWGTDSSSDPHHPDSSSDPHRTGSSRVKRQDKVVMLNPLASMLGMLAQKLEILATLFQPAVIVTTPADPGDDSGQAQKLKDRLHALLDSSAAPVTAEPQADALETVAEEDMEPSDQDVEEMGLEKEDEDAGDMDVPPLDYTLPIPVIVPSPMIDESQESLLDKVAEDIIEESAENMQHVMFGDDDAVILGTGPVVQLEALVSEESVEETDSVDVTADQTAVDAETIDAVVNEDELELITAEQDVVNQDSTDQEIFQIEEEVNFDGLIDQLAETFGEANDADFIPNGPEPRGERMTKRSTGAASIPSLYPFTVAAPTFTLPPNPGISSSVLPAASIPSFPFSSFGDDCVFNPYCRPSPDPTTVWQNSGWIQYPVRTNPIQYPEFR